MHRFLLRLPFLTGTSSYVLPSMPDSSLSNSSSLPRVSLPQRTRASLQCLPKLTVISQYGSWGSFASSLRNSFSVSAYTSVPLIRIAINAVTSPDCTQPKHGCPKNSRNRSSLLESRPPSTKLHQPLPPTASCPRASAKTCADPAFPSSAPSSFRPGPQPPSASTTDKSAHKLSLQKCPIVLRDNHPHVIARHRRHN